MKHNLATILKELNLYVGIDKASGMIPITPMHMEIDRMRKELEQLNEDCDEEKYIIDLEGNVWIRVDEVLG